MWKYFWVVNQEKKQLLVQDIEKALFNFIIHISLFLSNIMIFNVTLNQLIHG